MRGDRSSRAVRRAAERHPTSNGGLRSVRAMMAGLLLLCVAAPATAQEVVGAKNSKVYHLYPDECGSGKRIRPENAVRFASPEEAERAGRRLCKSCETLRLKKERGPAPRQPEKPGPQEPAESEPPQATREQTGDRRSLEGAGHGTIEIERPPVPPIFANVTAVLSGGTIELDVGEKVVLAGIVCPTEGQPLAEEARLYVAEQVAGRRVQVRADRLAGDERGRDWLGRLPGYVMADPDGRDLGSELLFKGYAWLDRSGRCERMREYVLREEEAWRAKRGIWKPLDGEAGRREVVIGRGAHHYHDPRCPHVPHLSGRITVTVNEAKERRLPPCPLFRDPAEQAKAHALMEIPIERP